MLSSSILGQKVDARTIDHYASYSREELKTLLNTNYNILVNIKSYNQDPSISCPSFTFPSYDYDVPPSDVPIVGKAKRTATIINNDGSTCIADIYVYVW